MNAAYCALPPWLPLQCMGLLIGVRTDAAGTLPSRLADWASGHMCLGMLPSLLAACSKESQRDSLKVHVVQIIACSGHVES